jgi:GNAT superfamily N-acetyltransferase
VETQVRRGTVTEVDSLMPLWVSMVEHHRKVAGAQWPVRSADAAWRIRQAEYRTWLTDGSGTLFVATVRQAPAPVGYAMLRVHEPGASWDLGAQRGAGVGTALMAACRDELRSRAIAYWSVAVVEANAGAARLYEREGFRPYYRLLLGEVDT